MNRRAFLYGAGATAAAGAGALGYGWLIEPERIGFTTHALPGDRFMASGSVAQITDLHLKEVGDEHEAIASEVERRSADIIVITGDSVDATADLDLLRDFLALLPYGVPKFAILGNWEHWGRVDLGRLAAAYERANGTLLVNRSVTHDGPGGSVRISGLDDLVGGSPQPAAIAPEHGASAPHILLAHCPAQRDRLPPETAVDLVLSGHTHGGQVQVLGRAPLVPRGSGGYLEGWYGGGGPPMYVSRGIGTSVLPIRFGAPPEVSFFAA